MNSVAEIVTMEVKNMKLCDCEVKLKLLC